MAIAETARLIASLELKDLFTKSVDSATKSMKGLDKQITNTQGRAYKAGQQIGTGIKRGVILATSALTGLAGLLLLSAKEGQHAADVQAVFANAIARSGKITAENVKALNAQSLALSNLTGMDDEQIKSEQTRLVQMKLSSKQILTLLPLILDAAKSTGRDLDSVTLAVGRAAQGSATSLGRLGIIIPKTAKKSKDAFGDVVKALQAFQGTNAALSGSLEVKLNVFHERLQDIREEAGIKLLPALVKITDTVTKSLLPAFQDFIDAILPSAIEGLNKFSDFLSSGQGAKSLSSVFNTIKTAAPIIQKSAEATFTIVKAAVDLFTSLPEGLQQLAVGAFAVNKLTSGLVTNVGGGIADFIGGKLGLIRGQTPGTPLFVSDVTGGIGGAAGAAGTAAGGVSGLVKSGAKLLGGLGLAIIAIEGLGELIKATSTPEQRAAGEANQIAAGRLKHGGGTKDVPTGSKNDPLAVTLLDRGGRETGTPGIAGLITKNIRNVLDAVRATFKTGFERMVQALHEARGNKAIEKAVKDAVHQVIELRKGSLSSTKATITGLKSALTHTHDPKTRAAIISALAKVQAKIPGREFAQRQLSLASRALADGKLSLNEEKALKRSAESLRQRGLPHAASLIEDKITAAKKAQVAATKAVEKRIRDQKFSVDVTGAVLVSLRNLAYTTTVAAQVHAGGAPGAFRGP